MLIPPVSCESWKAGAVCPPLSVMTNAIIFTFKIQLTFKRRVVIPDAQEHKQTNAHTDQNSPKQIRMQPHWFIQTWVTRNNCIKWIENYFMFFHWRSLVFTIASSFAFGCNVKATL